MQPVRIEGDFDTLARFVSDGLALVSSNGAIAGWSAGAAQATGVAEASALGRSLDELFARVDPPLGFAVLPQDLTIVSRGEHRRALYARALTTEGGWLISFGRQHRFDAIEQLKNEIVTAVSHELKTPIATIKAFATTMRQNPTAATVDREEFLTTIEEQADQLARVVDELLLAGRVDAEHLLTERRDVAIAQLLDDVSRRLGPTRAARIERDVRDVIVNCDGELLGEALAHLIDNALKYSPDTSRVLVTACSDERSAEIRVIDRGIGIGQDHMPYIFERFYRAEANLVSLTGGTGLGLYIVRAVARAHGGAIEVESGIHQGTTMTLRLPVRG